jgi:hypothetical protein
MPAAAANSSPRAFAELDTTSRTSTGNEPAAIRSSRLRSVVPPPEIRTATGNGAPTDRSEAGVDVEPLAESGCEGFVMVETAVGKASWQSTRCSER